MNTEFNPDTDDWMFLVATPKDLERNGGDPFKSNPIHCPHVSEDLKSEDPIIVFSYTTWRIFLYENK